jgi:hypothetical protein
MPTATQKRTAAQKKTAAEKKEPVEKKESAPKVDHVTEALKIAGSVLPFRSESERVAFYDHVTLAGGAENKDQTAAAKERHDAAVKAKKDAEG